MKELEAEEKRAQSGFFQEGGPVKSRGDESSLTVEKKPNVSNIDNESAPDNAQFRSNPKVTKADNDG